MAFSSMSWTLRAEETRVARIARQNERVQEARTPTCPPYRRAKNSVAQLSWGAIGAPHNAAVAWSITRNSSEATSMAIIVVGGGAAGLMTGGARLMIEAMLPLLHNLTTSRAWPEKVGGAFSWGGARGWHGPRTS